MRITLDPACVGIVGKLAPLTEMFGYMDAQYARLRAALTGEDVLELSYEDDIAEDPRVACARVCAWLGLEAADTTTDLSRTNTRELSEVIDNWDEVVATLADTPYAWMTA